jgi:seryl-tRNA synthetase
MLDIRLIRENPDSIKEQLKKKGDYSEAIDQSLVLDEQRRNFQLEYDNLRQQQNAASKKIPSLAGTEKEQVLGEMKEVAAGLKLVEEKLREAEEQFNQVFWTIPNVCHESVPKGADDDDNVEIEQVGEIPEFDFEPKEHWELAESLGILDMERAAKVSGSRFYFLRDELAILQMALMNWAFLEIQKKGFSPTIPPFLVREMALFGTGFFPADKNEIYSVNPGEDDLFLIGTSEVPLTAYYADEILEAESLPARFAGYSPCFRREAGSYGKDMKGILRVHQFEKIEMVVVCAPEDSWQIHEELREVEKELLSALKIPFRVVNICGGDLGGSAAKKYDLEAWLPGQGKFREMTSTSNCTDYQARRLKIRVRQKNGEIVTAHTLNGTAVSSRPLIAIMENFQKADGSIDIPEVLWPFAGGLKRIEPKQ